MATVDIDRAPGFRRRIHIAPRPGAVSCELEDDYHCMRVAVEHAAGVARRIEAQVRRAPWSTCPGAEAELGSTFTGIALADFAGRGAKKANCTHLYDLAIMAAAHAADTGPCTYDFLVSDPVDGRREAEARRDGERVLAWTEQRARIVSPAALAGQSLWDLREWLAAQSPALAEAARMLRWVNLMANGRVIPTFRSEIRPLPETTVLRGPARPTVPVLAIRKVPSRGYWPASTQSRRRTYCEQRTNSVHCVLSWPAAVSVRCRPPESRS